MHVCVEQIHRLPDSLPKWIQRSGVIGTPSRMWREPKRTAGDSIKLLKSLSYTREWLCGIAPPRQADVISPVSYSECDRTWDALSNSQRDRQSTRVSQLCEPVAGKNKSTLEARMRHSIHPIIAEKPKLQLCFYPGISLHLKRRSGAVEVARCCNYCISNLAVQHAQAALRL